jgi:heat shock protein HslJ
MRKSLGLVCGALAAVALLAGCAASGGSGSGETSSGGPNAAIVGQWGSSATGQPNLTFTDKGTVSGTDGCNRISTRYTLHGTTATLDHFVSTMMACEGVDTWLITVHTVSISGDKLLAKNAAGAQIGTLAKQK